MSADATKAIAAIRTTPPSVPRRFLSRAFAVLRACIAVVLVLGASAASAQLLLVVSEGAGVYGDVAKDVARRVRSVAPQVQVDTVGASEAPAIDAERLRRYALAVTVGLDGADALISRSQGQATHAPILALLVPRDRFGELAATAHAEHDARVSAIFIEQPLARQLDLVALALPGRSRVGVLLGPSSTRLARNLDDAARAAGLDLRQTQASDPAAVYPALQRVLVQSDVLLAVPDPVAINAATIRSVLVASHRAGVPVVGFSQALVDAGALLAVYSTPQQYARQAAEIALGVLDGSAPLPRPHYPRYFTVGVNFLAAQAIGLALDDETSLATALAVREREKDRVRSQSRLPARAATGSSP